MPFVRQDALAGKRPDLERYIARHLDCPEPFRVVFDESAVSIREVSGLTVAPMADADYPPFVVTVTIP